MSCARNAATFEKLKLQKINISGKFSIGKFCQHNEQPGRNFFPRDGNAKTSENCIAIASQKLPT